MGGGRTYLWRSGTLDDAVLLDGGPSVAFVPGERAGVPVGSPDSGWFEEDDGGVVYWYHDFSADGDYRRRLWYGAAGQHAGAAVAALPGLHADDSPLLVFGAPDAFAGGAVYVLPAE